jgi:hypothetical protein
MTFPFLGNSIHYFILNSPLTLGRGNLPAQKFAKHSSRIMRKKLLIGNLI